MFSLTLQFRAEDVDTSTLLHIHGWFILLAMRINLSGCVINGHQVVTVSRELIVMMLPQFM
jgi:hypothetical protein